MTDVAAPSTHRAALAPVWDRLRGLERLEAPVVVGCSGGPDSITALAVAVAAGLEPVAVHVDHGLRVDSGREADTVARVASDLGASFHSCSAAVAPGRNVEERARDARYAALEAAADLVGAHAILVGHTADDQAETVLLAVLRGSATAGLAAMAVRRGRIVRPLLDVRRAETEVCAAALGTEIVRDPTNDDRTYRRAWVRHEALPLLNAGAGRDLVPVLARQAEVLRTETEYLDELARAAWPPESSNPVASVLGCLPVVLARRAVRQWLGTPPPGFDEVERVLSVARGDSVGTQLRGGRAVRRRGGVLLIDDDAGADAGAGR